MEEVRYLSELIARDREARQKEELEKLGLIIEAIHGRAIH